MGYKNPEDAKAYRRSYYLRNKDRIDAKNRASSKYYHERRSTVPEAIATYRAYRERTRTRRLLRVIELKCEKLGLPFDLTETDIVIPEFCPVLGTRLTVGVGKGDYTAASIDRIAPDKGYVRGNIVIVSGRANRIKTNATIDELVKVHKFYTELTGYYHTS